MTWWQWGMLVASVVAISVLLDIAKAVREVKFEVNRLRVTMTELDKAPIDRSPLP